MGCRSSKKEKTEPPERPPLRADPESHVLLWTLRSHFDRNYDGHVASKDLNRVGELLKVEPRTDNPEFLDSDEWEDNIATMLLQVSPERDEQTTKFKAMARELLSIPFAEAPELCVGPIIGKVTDVTARILVESTHDTELACKLTPEEGSGDVAEKTQQINKCSPTILVFEGLSPLTKYNVTFSGAKALVEKCSFTTLPQGGWKLSHGLNPRFAVASCNCIATTWEMETNSPANLWVNIANRLRQGERVDYMFHLGDNVYMDHEWCTIEKGKKELTGGHCKWGLAHQYMSQFKLGELHLGEKDVEMLFRTIYRETFGHPGQRYVLANVPNLMIMDDHDIRDDWGDRLADLDTSSLEFFMANIGYRILKEYQKQLHVDLDDETHSNREYHFHSFGDIGLIFLDLRASKTFWRRPVDVAAPMLGVNQWRDLEDAMFSEDDGGVGTFIKSKTLLVFSPEPVAYVSPKPTKAAGATVCDDLLGQWSAPEHVSESSRLLHLLRGWCLADKQRAVLLLGGDVHEGGWTDIQLAARQKHGRAVIRQLTTSAISNKMTSHLEALAVFMTRDIASGIDGWTLCAGWGYTHYNWTNKRNYAFVDISMCGPKAVIRGQLITSNGDEVTERKSHDTSEKTSGKRTRLNAARHELSHHVGQGVGGMFKKKKGSGGKNSPKGELKDTLPKKESE